MTQAHIRVRRLDEAKPWEKDYRYCGIVPSHEAGYLIDTLLRNGHITPKDVIEIEEIA